MTRTISDAVREVCLAFPEAEEFVSHGSPNFRPKGGKVFAVYLVNHHGDGRVALWLASPPGIQALRVQGEPAHFFVPPYVGPRGWLGVQLDTGLSWKRIAALVREAYENVAPPKLVARIAKTPVVAKPDAPPPATERDPLDTPEGRRALAAARATFGAFPEATEDTQYGTPLWRAGKRAFAMAFALDGRACLAFRVDGARQALLGDDPRWRVPPYWGAQGWMALDVSKRLDRDEIRELARDSYRAVALKRMLGKLETLPPPARRGRR